MISKVVSATAEVRRRWPTVPQVSLVLGTGLGQLARQIAVERTIAFSEIPGFARTTAIAHRGQLVCGTLRDIPIMLLDGRCHLYEGYSFDDVTLPIRVVQACGARTLIVTNASGGLNLHYAPSDILVIDDHINLLGRALRRPSGGPRICRPVRPTPTPYDPQLVQRALAVARHGHFTAHRGVYAAVIGPNYETRAEYAFLRRIGADAVGMSTVPEVCVAAQLGMRILGLSIVTNVAHIESPQAVNSCHVVSAAERAAPNIRSIVDEVLRSLGNAREGA